MRALTLAVVLGVVSSYVVGNLGGRPALLLYPVVAFVVLLAVVPALAALLRRAPGWVPAAVAVVVVAGLIAAFVAGIPADYRAAFGAGSDRAEALDIVLTRLTSGLYPYAATTSVGNPISPLPGSFVLAAPFWWLTGRSAWQNVAWLVLLLAVCSGRLRPAPRPTVLWALVVVGGLEVLREFLVGDDLVWSAVPAVAATAWTLRAADRSSGGVLAAAAVVLGVTTCTRPHLVLVLVIVAAAVGVRAGWRRAAVVGGVAALTWMALIVPFLAGGVARFSPLHVAAKVTGDRALTPGIILVALAALALVGLALALLRPSAPETVGWLAALVLFAPSVLSFAHAALTGAWGELDLTLGAGAVPFALWATSVAVPAAPGVRVPREPAAMPG